MIYSYTIDTPANTSELSRIKTDLKLTAGIIHKVELVFPSGCAGFLYAAINHGLHQIWPTNPGEYFRTDGETISFDEYYELTSGENIITVYTYNLDETYDHELIVRLGILQKSELQGIWLPWSEEVIL